MANEKAIYAGYRTATSRLGEVAVAGMEDLKNSLPADALVSIHLYDKAHALALLEENIIPAEAGRKILAALRKLDGQDMAGERARVGGGLHSGERILAEMIGRDVSGHLHTGRSSGDTGGVTRRITYRRHVLTILDRLIELRHVLLDMQMRHADVVMPGYTHAQHAQPITFALWLGMFDEVWSRDTERFFAVYDRLNRSPAGAAVMTGSDFPLNRQRLSGLLGFSGPLANTMDATLSNDFESEYAAALTILGQGMSRIADDLMLWSSAEFAMVELADRYCNTSSIMAQKKNPDALELIKLQAAKAFGVLSAVCMAERGPSGLMMAERHGTQRLLWDTGRDVATQLAHLSGILATLQVKDRRMRYLAGANWAQATDIAGAMVQHAEFDWRTAHQVVGRFVRQCIEADITPDIARTEQLDAAAIAIGVPPPTLSPERFAAAVDPVAFVGRRDILGGPGPEASKSRLESAQQRLGRDEQALAALRHHLDSAEQRLDAAIDAAVGK